MFQDADACFTRCSAFLTALFRVTKFVLTENCQANTREEAAQWFREYMGTDMTFKKHGPNRQSFTAQVFELAHHLVGS